MITVASRKPEGEKLNAQIHTETQTKAVPEHRQAENGDAPTRVNQALDSKATVAPSPSCSEPTARDQTKASVYEQRRAKNGGVPTKVNEAHDSRSALASSSSRPKPNILAKLWKPQKRSFGQEAAAHKAPAVVAPPHCESLASAKKLSDDEEFGEAKDPEKEFLKKWDLNTDNAVDLMTCTHEQRLYIISSWKHDKGTMSIHDAFLKFVNQVKSTGKNFQKWLANREVKVREELVKAKEEVDGAPQTPESLQSPEVEEVPLTPPDQEEDGTHVDEEEMAMRSNDRIELFGFKNELDDKAVQALRDLSPELQADVMEHYNSQDSQGGHLALCSSNPSARFMKFLKTRKNRFMMKVSKSNALGVAIQDQLGESVKQFVQKWDLAEDALLLLQSLPANICQDVIAKFKPHSNIDINSKFMQFVKYKRSQTSDPVQEFAGRWKLNDEAVGHLRSMTRSLANEVMVAFSPHDESKDVSNAFIAFAKSRLRTHQSFRGAYDEFVAEYQLSAEASEFLYCLPKRIADQAVADFSLPPDSRDISERFLSFCVKRLLKSQNAVDPVEEFATKYDLNSDARNYLRSLQPPLQAAVMTRFHTNKNTGVSGWFLSFAKSRKSTFMQQHDAVSQFAVCWDLDDEAVNLLRECPQETQKYVIENFWPPAQGDVKKQFRKYVQVQGFAEINTKPTKASVATLASRVGEQPKAALPLAAFQQSWGLDDDAIRRLADLPAEIQASIIADFKPVVIAYGKQEWRESVNAKFVAFLHSRASTKGKRQQDSKHELIAFQQSWGLDDDAIRRLADLPAEVQANIIADFRPVVTAYGKQEWRESVNAKFVAFLHSRASTKGKCQQDSKHELIAFQQSWGLDDEAIAQLARCPPETQAKIVANFNPKVNHNINAKFMSFLRSTVDQSGGYESKHDLFAFQRSWGLDDDAIVQLARCPPELQAKIIAEFSPKGEWHANFNINAKFMSFLRSMDRAGGYASKHDLIAFQQSWGLDDDAILQLARCPPDVQATVIANFNPKGEWHENYNINAKFIPYLRSVANNSMYDVTTFQKSWGLDDDAIGKLAHYPQEFQAKVIANFSPNSEWHENFNINAKFITFLRSMEKQDWKHTLTAFQQSWGLDDDAIVQLACCPPEVQEKIIADFHPTGEWHDKYKINAKFIAFLHSRTNTVGYYEQDWKRQRTK